MKKKLNGFPVVGIGASAGGLSAIEELFDNIPSNTGMAFVIIQHLSPDFKSLMADLLSRHTKMEILNVTDGIPMKPNTVYLNPPKTEVIVEGNRLRLTEKDKEQHLNLPIDKFFKSLSAEFKERVLAVVLSGTGSDGSRGIQTVHENGGFVIVQQPETSQFDGMPKAAAATGVCDAILPPKQIAKLLAAYGKNPKTTRDKKVWIEKIASDGGYYGSVFSGVFDLLKNKFNIDFSKYKITTVSRRIARRLEFLQLNEIREYIEYLFKNPEELENLYRDLLIGVTEFFRDPKVFQVLSQQIFPEIFLNRPQADDVRIWSAGCATGEEAYSLAILTLETARKFDFKGKIVVFATDVHKSSLDSASQGLYERQQIKNVPEELLSRYFKSEGNSFRIIPELRKFVAFAPHNLVNDPPFTKLDLICCRNLLIYLQPEVQEKIISVLHFSLRLNGVLLLGKSEGVGRLAGDFDSIDNASKLFRKIRDTKIPMSFSRSPQSLTSSPLIQHDQKKSVAIDRQLLHDYDLLLKKHVHQGVLINEQRQIVHIFDDSLLLFGGRSGRFENDIFQLADERIRAHLITAFNKAEKNKSMIITNHVFSVDDTVYDLVIDCLPDEKTAQWHYFIGLREAINEASQEKRKKKAITIGKEDIPVLLQQKISDMEQELTVARAHLQSTIEELQTSNEELQATNEELLAANEELQSTNEELHSVNEELYTVNSEFEAKNEELKRLNLDHENLLISTEVGTVFIDRSLNIRKFNPAIGRFFKLIPQDIGRPIDHIAYQLKNQKRLMEDIGLVLNTGRVLESEELTSDDVWVLKRILPFKTEKDGIEGVVLTFTDITKIKESEQLLARLNNSLEERVKARTADLEKARDAAEVANEAKSLFLATMSHEIRTPMSGILGMAQLMDDSGLDEKQKIYLKNLRTSAENLLAILNDIIDFSKIEAGRLDIVPVPFNFYEAIHEILNIHKPRIEAKKLNLELKIDDSVPETILADKIRIRQILFNLLSNSIKFTERGTVGIRVSAERKEKKHFDIQIEVYDTGIGIQEEIVRHLFKPFMQADSSISKKYGGTGLGLAICKQLVELMDGRIWTESIPNEGSRFFIVFPVEPVESEGSASKSSDAAESMEIRPAVQKRILVAEDEAIIQYFLVNVLRGRGHKADGALNGKEALRILREKEFDLVLMDISMPEMDGFEAFKSMRDQGYAIPVIALTAHALKEEQERILSEGFDDIALKPVNVESLIAKIDRLPVEQRLSRDQ